MAASNLRVKIIEQDNIRELQKALSDFLSSISNRIVSDVIIEADALFNGNKIYVATVLYDSVTDARTPASVMLFEKDNNIDLQNAMNTFIATGSDPSIIRNEEIILKNGNNSYIGLVGYNIGASGSGSGINIEFGTFTRNAGDGNGTQTISTVKMAKIIFLTGFDVNTNQIVSSGNSIGGNSNGNGVITSSPFGASNHGPDSNCIDVTDFGGNSFIGKILTINPTNFIVTWTQFNAGIDVRVQWHAITG